MHRPVFAMFALAPMLATAAAPADVNLEFRPGCHEFSFLETTDVGLYVVSDHPTESRLVSELDVAFTWPRNVVGLLTVSPTSPLRLAYSDFPYPSGPNESLSDGDAWYAARALPGPENAIVATPEGTLVTTFTFLAFYGGGTGTVDIVRATGDPPVATRVLGFGRPGADVTGALLGADIIVDFGCPGPADVDDSGTVNVDDLVQVILAWGPCAAPPETCVEDIDGDGAVDVDDLVQIVLDFGPCVPQTCP